MIYELRTYHIYPDRMDAIHKRFAEHTIALFNKHDITIVDFWENLDGDKIHYILEHKDMETKNLNWTAFMNDPAWLEVKRQSELSGPIVKKIDVYFMKRVPYSPVKKKK